jgi:hypothetical protein
MAKGRAGADSVALVTEDLIRQAQDLFEDVPVVLWGRYFTSLSTGEDGEYQHLRESQVLRAAGIPVLPIARQTDHVGGTRDQGSIDAEANVEDLIGSFGADYLSSQGGKFFMFLDVEIENPISPEYYIGWAQTLVRHSTAITGGSVQILPCVYASQGDTDTWEALATATVDDQGVKCHGVWVARWIHGKDLGGCSNLDDWDETFVPPGVEIPCKILLWQYQNDCGDGDGFDGNQTNPHIRLKRDLLARLILPPDTIGVV